MVAAEIEHPKSPTAEFSKRPGSSAKEGLIADGQDGSAIHRPPF